MEHRIVGTIVIAIGVTLGGEAVMAQTAGPSLGAPSPSIVPVTGPSTGPDLSEAAKPRLIPASPATTATARAPRAVKVVHKPGAKPVVKKASTPKRAKVAVRPTKTKQVATTKGRAPTSRSVSGQPANPSKRQAPAKNGSPATTVLPRV